MQAVRQTHTKLRQLWWRCTLCIHTFDICYSRCCLCRIDTVVYWVAVYCNIHCVCIRNTYVRMNVSAKAMLPLVATTAKWIFIPFVLLTIRFRLLQIECSNNSISLVALVLFEYIFFSLYSSSFHSIFAVDFGFISLPSSNFNSTLIVCHSRFKVAKWHIWSEHHLAMLDDSSLSFSLEYLYIFNAYNTNGSLLSLRWR